MFENLNYRPTIREGINVNEMEFVPFKEFRGTELNVDGFFFTDGFYGEQVVVIANGAKINMPHHALRAFKRIYNRQNLLNAVLEGHLMLTDIRAEQTPNGETTVFTMKDC